MALAWVRNIEDETKTNTTFRNALWTGKHSQLTVMSIRPGEGRLAGIATESDLTGIRSSRVLSARAETVGDRVKIAGAEQSYDEILSRPVEEVMTRQMVAAAEDEPISDVVIKMMDYDLRHMPVVDVDVPVGIVARHDLLALLARRCR